MIQINLKSLRKKSSNILPFIAFILFIGNYHICNYFYPGDSESDISNWWDLKNDIYSLVIAILFVYASSKNKGVLSLFLDVFTGLAIANVVDRFIFNIREFKTNDIIMIVCTIIFAIWNYRKSYGK